MGYFVLFAFLCLLQCCFPANVSARSETVAEDAALFSVLKPVKAVRMLGRGFRNATATLNRIDAMLNNAMIQALSFLRGHNDHYRKVHIFPFHISSLFSIFGSFALAQECEKYHRFKPYGVIHVGGNDKRYVMCSARGFQDLKNMTLIGKEYALYEWFGKASSPEELLTWYSMFVLTSIKGSIVGHMCLHDEYEGHKEMKKVLKTYRRKTREDLKELLETLKEQFMRYSFNSSYVEAISYASKHATKNFNKNNRLIWPTVPLIQCCSITVPQRDANLENFISFHFIYYIYKIRI